MANVAMWGRMPWLCPTGFRYAGAWYSDYEIADYNALPEVANEAPWWPTSYGNRLLGFFSEDENAHHVHRSRLHMLLGHYRCLRPGGVNVLLCCV
jgi:hypothetical protein